MGGAEGVPCPPVLSLSAHLRNVDCVRQRCNADETCRKSYFSGDWARAKFTCQQIAVLYPTSNFL